MPKSATEAEGRASGQLQEVWFSEACLALVQQAAFRAISDKSDLKREKTRQEKCPCN